jgi:hypothetical protein
LISRECVRQTLLKTGLGCARQRSGAIFVGVGWVDKVSRRISKTLIFWEPGFEVRRGKLLISFVRLIASLSARKLVTPSQDWLTLRSLGIAHADRLNHRAHVILSKIEQATILAASIKLQGDCMFIKVVAVLL